MAATIDSLPPELLLRIAELRIAPLWAYPRNEALKTLSLVSRRWRMPAQALLHNYVFIKTRECAERLIHGQTPGQFHTHELDIVGNSNLSSNQTGDVVRSRIGVRILRLRSFYQLHENVLYESSLEDLHTLSLENTLQIFPSLIPAFRHPFSLTSLTLDSLAHVPPSLIASLFLSSPHLEFLTIAIHPSCQDLPLSIEAAFPSVAPTLTHLSTSFVTPDVLRCAGRLVSLEHKVFSSSETLEEAVRSIPADRNPKLRKLGTFARDWNLGRELLRTIALPACALLEVLELRAWAEDEVVRSEWGPDLVAACKKRGLELLLEPIKLL